MTINTKATKRVLIVDDQPQVLDVLREILARFQHEHAYEITTARSVDDALAILQRERFDLILLDMVMPGIGDPLLRRRVRGLHAQALSRHDHTLGWPGPPAAAHPPIPPTPPPRG